MARRNLARKKLGHAAFQFTDAERVQLAEARERLSRVGANLNEAVEFFLRHARPPREPVGFEELARLCALAKEDAGMGAHYLRQVRSVARIFARAGHGDRPAHEIVRQEVEGWLREYTRTPKTWNNYVGMLGSIFEWGRAEGYLSLNPCEGVARKRAAREEEVEFLTVGQCEALLARAAAERPGAVRRGADGQWIKYPLEDECFRDCVPMVVIGLFCGLRPDKELGRMTWREVKLESDLVIVTAGRAKSRRRRTVDLSANARAWLEWWLRASGFVDAGPPPERHVCPRNLKRRWKRLRMACGLFDEWPHDGMRHTFATYHYAAHQNEARLQVLMGHTSAQMLHDHYRGLATPAEAAAFWALAPPQ